MARRGDDHGIENEPALRGMTPPGLGDTPSPPPTDPPTHSPAHLPAHSSGSPEGGAHHTPPLGPPAPPTTPARTPQPPQPPQPGPLGEPDDSEQKAERVLARERLRDRGSAHHHSVHDELAILPSDHDAPALIDRDFSCAQCGYNLRGLRVGQPCPECAYVQFERPSPSDRVGYAQWLAGRIAATPRSRTWAVTVAVALLSGAWAVLGAFWNAGAGGSGFFAIAVWGPAIEEVMKVALIAVVIERWAYLFASRGQIMLAALGAGLMFAVIENLLYLFVYIPNAPTGMIIWRWTVCVSLHVGCTAVAGYGAARVWHRTVTQLRPATIPVDMTFLVVAILIHGVYNGTVTLLELSGVSF